MTGPTVYGTAPNPGAPGTWRREVWWALNRSARVGRGTGRNSRGLKPPFHLHGMLVMSGEPRLPYGRSVAGQAYLTHMPHTMLFAWKSGAIVGRMVAWWCGSRTAYFRMMDEPDSPLCPMCVFRAGQA